MKITRGLHYISLYLYYLSIEYIECFEWGSFRQFPCVEPFTVTGERGLVNIVRPKDTPNLLVEPTDCHCLIYPGSGSWPDGENHIIDLKYGTSTFIRIATCTKNGPLHAYDSVPFILNTNSNGRLRMNFFNSLGEYTPSTLNPGGSGYYRFNPGNDC